jgi:hypothetical protein
MAPPPPPSQLFKYAKWAHSENLIRWGTIRVGTLIDYQNTERHGSGIGEKDEGVKRRYDNPLVTRAGGLSSFAREGFIPSGLWPNPEDGPLFVQCIFEKEDRSPNCWLYCTSERLGFRVMDSMEGGYDSCVRINHVVGFFQIIGKALHDQGLITCGQIVRVKYRDRTQHYQADDGLPPYALKDSRYAKQEEIRFVYFPAREITVTHIDLTLPWLKALCEPATDIPG